MDVIEDTRSMFMFPMRKSLRKQIAVKAAEAGTTMRGFVLAALKEKGLDVYDDEIVDRRSLREERVASA